ALNAQGAWDASAILPISLWDCHFDRCGGVAGGAVSFKYSRANVFDSHFRDNWAYTSGGAVLTEDATVLDIQGGRFSRNQLRQIDPNDNAITTQWVNIYLREGAAVAAFGFRLW